MDKVLVLGGMTLFILLIGYLLGFWVAEVKRDNKEQDQRQKRDERESAEQTFKYRVTRVFADDFNMQLLLSYYDDFKKRLAEKEEIAKLRDKLAKQKGEK